MIRLTLPWPPSANRIWRQHQGRVLLSREGKAYRQAVLGEWLQAQRQGLGRQQLRLVIDAHMPDTRRRDLDNLNKAALDAMQAARVFEDDSQVIDLHIRHAGIDRANPRLEITLEAA